MKILLRNKKLQMCVCLILVMIMVSTISFALGNQDEELQKKYAAILGEYEFDLSEFGQEAIYVTFRIESGSLWADSGDGEPTTLVLSGDEPYEFTSDDPDSGSLEIKFLKDEEDKYTMCTIAILDQGVEVTGIKTGK